MLCLLFHSSFTIHTLKISLLLKFPPNSSSIIFEQLWQEILDRGRYVKADELPDELIDAFRVERVSLKRAEQYCRQSFLRR